MIIDCDREDLVELLAWYGELGVDCTLADDAVDWLQHGEAAPGAAVRQAVRSAQNGGAAVLRPRSGHSAARRQPAVIEPGAGASGQPSAANGPTSAQVTPGVAPKRPARLVGDAGGGQAAGQGSAAARILAAAATSLNDLGKALEEFEGCALRATAKNTCFYRGASAARLMVIGEAPGREEDLAGVPFVGQAGQLLDRMLASIGLSEKDVHITNVVYWRPPGNRAPTLQETESCRPFLERQTQLVAPDFILLVGGAAAKSVLESQEGIMRLRGKWKELSLGGRKLRALPTLHPAYLLRTPAAKRQAWRDLLSLQTALAQGAGG